MNLLLVSERSYLGDQTIERLVAESTSFESAMDRSIQIFGQFSITTGSLGPVSTTSIDGPIQVVRCDQKDTDTCRLQLIAYMSTCILLLKRFWRALKSRGQTCESRRATINGLNIDNRSVALEHELQHLARHNINSQLFIGLGRAHV